MKRRNFVKTSAAAAGLLASIELSSMQAVAETESPTIEPLDGDNRPTEYLKRVQKLPLSPKAPVSGKTYPIPPMPLAERISKKIVPEQGFCSVAPGTVVREALTSGNGSITIELMGDPYSEKILFHHENLLMPWKKPVEAPNVASIFPQVRQLILDGKDKEAVAVAMQKMNESPIKQDTEPPLTVPAFQMNLELPKAKSAKDYLRTTNFESNELKVYWTDENGSWVRQTFCSRPDNVVVQKLAAPSGKTLNVRISLEKSPEWTMVSGMDWGAKQGIGSTDPDMRAFVSLTADQKKLAPKGVEANEVKQEVSDQSMVSSGRDSKSHSERTSEQTLIYKCRLDPTVDNSGFAGVTRVVRTGGTAKTEGNDLVIANATSVILLTRIEYFTEFTDDKTVGVKQAVEKINPDYTALLDKHQKVQSEMLNRVKIDFGPDAQYGLATEELFVDQLVRPNFSATLLKKIFEMGRYWFIINSGSYPAIAHEVNSTINLTTAGAVQGDLREGMDAYFRWMEEIAADTQGNAKNIFGLKGNSYPLFPDKKLGASLYYTPSSEIGIWPYWISAGGWLLRQFWEHYLVTGDVEFLRNRVVPAYKGLAAFYEDFLTTTDKNGNYLFVPSISPENTPSRSTVPGPTMVNATMDIAVCREVLTNLVASCETLGTEGGNVAKWKAMLAKMPPYLTEQDGTLKEWAWPSLQERNAHRHISHLYGVWPGDEIDPDRTPKLARAAEIAGRRRTFDIMPNAIAGETLAAYTRCHRALVGTRLKDNVLVDVQLRQLMEQGYVSNALRCSREPYAIPIPDAQAGIPAVVMEMLLYSRPGVLEVLPALPKALKKGSISGMLARTFARVNKLSWDMDAKTVNIAITSVKKQDLTLVARHGIEEISAPAGVLGEFTKGKADCELHLPEKQTVEIRLKLGNHKPLEWVNQVV